MSRIILKNCYGKILDPNNQRQLISPEYGKIDSNGRIYPNWKDPDDDVDCNGFDEHNIEKNGDYIVEMELVKGTVLCRYGYENGQFSTYKGVPYEQLSLPWKKETQPYFEYEVIADGYFVKCIVTKGKVGAAFGSVGGAIQFKHPHSLRQEVEVYKTLRRITI